MKKNLLKMLIKVSSELFGKTKSGKNIMRFTLANGNGLSVRIIDFGATITEIIVPDKNGILEDINLGFDTVEEYEEKPGYLGGFIGRVANRIAGGEFTLDDDTYKLFCNNGQHCLHGGHTGFNKRIWTSEIKNDHLILTYVSPDGEENFPGDLTITADYHLDEHNKFCMTYTATTTKATLLNLTEHTYLNLGGHDHGDISDHVVTIPAFFWIPLDENGVPTGERRHVEESEYDLRHPIRLGDVVDKISTGRGFENYFCLDTSTDLKLAARVEHPSSGRFLELHTTEPGLQFYTSYYLPDITGKNNANYRKFCAIDLEAQHYPDSIHQPNFPNTVLRPGETYVQTTVYTFGVL